MAIYLKNSWNVPPARWGSFGDVQYAVKINYEKIYGIDPNDSVLDIPGFWGLPGKDYSGNAPLTINGIQKDGNLYFSGEPNFIDTHIAYTYSGELSIICRINPDKAHNTGSVEGRRVWSQLTGTTVPELSFQVFLNDNFYAGFNHTVDSRVVLAASAANWLQYQWQTYILTCISGGYTRLYHEGAEIGNNGGGTVFYNPSSSFRFARFGDIGGAAGYFEGGASTFSILKCALTANQSAKFTELPYALYQKVPKPFYSLPTGPTTKFYGLNTEISGGSESIQDLTTNIQVNAESFFDLQTEISVTTVQTILDIDTEIAADYNISFVDLVTDIQTVAELLSDLDTDISATTQPETIIDLSTDIQAVSDVVYYDLGTDIQAGEQLFYDLRAEISVVRSKYWLGTEIEALSYAKWSFNTEWNPNRFLSTEIAAKKPYSFSFKTQTGSSYAAATSEIEILLSGYTWPLRTLFLDYLRVGTSNVYNFELWWVRGQSGKNSLKNAKIKAEYTTTQFAGGYEVVTCDWLTCRVNGGAEQTINETFADLGNMPCDSKLDIELTVDCRDCSLTRGLVFFKLIIVGDSKEAIYGAPIVYGEGTQYFEGEYDNYTADNFICRLYVV